MMNPGQLERWLPSRAEFDAVVHGLQASITDRLDQILRESLIPQLVVMSRIAPGAAAEYAMFMLDVEFNDDRQKRQVMRGLGRQFHADAKCPIALALASEAWWAEWTVEQPLVGQPRDQPDRKEIILIAAADIGMRRREYAIMEIGRRDGMIVPGPWGPLQEGGEMFLLEQFIEGFLAAFVAEMMEECLGGTTKMNAAHGRIHPWPRNPASTSGPT
jgi:hypothetical protein